MDKQAQVRGGGVFSFSFSLQPSGPSNHLTASPCLYQLLCALPHPPHPIPGKTYTVDGYPYDVADGMAAGRARVRPLFKSVVADDVGVRAYNFGGPCPPLLLRF